MRKAGCFDFIATIVAIAEDIIDMKGLSVGIVFISWPIFSFR